jgi:hypothetical protein
MAAPMQMVMDLGARDLQHYGLTECYGNSNVRRLRSRRRPAPHGGPPPARHGDTHVERDTRRPLPAGEIGRSSSAAT